MDQIKGVFNGNFDSIENIKISPFSRAYTFSDSIYEVVPFYKSNIIAFNLHMQRLFNSAEAKIPIIEGVFSLEDLSKANAVWLTSSTKGISLVDEIINLESTLKINDPLFIKSKSLFDNKFFS